MIDRTCTEKIGGDVISFLWSSNVEWEIVTTLVLIIIYMRSITCEMSVYIGNKSIMENNLSLCSILDANKLTLPNFIDWFRNIKIVLKQEKKAYVYDDPILEELNEEASNEEIRLIEFIWMISILQHV